MIIHNIFPSSLDIQRLTEDQKRKNVVIDKPNNYKAVKQWNPKNQ